MIFKEDITEKNNKLIIKVTTTSIRKYAHQKKEVYRKNIENLIPSHLKGKVTLISSPQKSISNFKSKNHIFEGEWVFDLEQDKPPAPAIKKETQTKRTRTRRKKA